jgi:hypothetical protein
MIKDQTSVVSSEFDQNYDIVMSKIQDLRRSLSESQQHILDVITTDETCCQDNDVNHRWIHIGYVGVDSAAMIIADPCYKDADIVWENDGTGMLVENNIELGVAIFPGSGDGYYPVYAQVCDEREHDCPSYLGVRVDFNY